MIDVLIELGLSWFKHYFSKPANAPLGEDKIISVLSRNKVGKRQNPLQSFSFSFCRACVMMGYYCVGSLAYFISCCRAFPTLYLSPSAAETRHGCWMLAEDSFTTKTNTTHIFVNIQTTLAHHSPRYAHTTISQWKSFKGRNGTFKWKHTHQHVIHSHTICQVIKAASQPDKHMPAVPHTTSAALSDTRMQTEW